MKQLIYAVICLILLSGGSHAAVSDSATPPPEKAELIALIKDLAIVNEKGEACGEHMNYYGKKALEGRVCIEFKQAFYQRWQSRKALLEIVNRYRTRFKLGEFNFENCDSTLQRIEELRIFVTYYLDYMDFQAEL